ncbi:MAG: protein kinase domain-containing protein [Pseudonocardiaceae bacterium]
MTTPTGTTPGEPAPRLVAGRYRLGAVLGRGAMGTVWSAHDEVLGRPVAVKEVLLPPGMPDAEADLLRERSLREARAIAALSHPNVVTLYDVVREDAAPFVVMELVASQSLAEVLRTGPVPQQRVVAVGAAVAAALQAAHAAGITHRDVKPGNVLMAHDGRIKLTDFGIARNPADQTMTATGLMLGSPAYIAPEVASGGQVSPAADLWGLGATLYAAVEGKPPYDAGDPVMTVSSVVLGEVPRASCSGPLAEVIGGLMVKDPAARMSLVEVRRLLGPPLITEPAAPAKPAGSAKPTASTTPTAPAERAAASEPPSYAPAAPGSSTGQLAAEPGPLPFTAGVHRDATGSGTAASAGPLSPPRPARGGEREAHKAARRALRAMVLWTLAVALFLGATCVGYAAARVVSGAPVLPDLGAGGTAAEGAVPVGRVVEVVESDGSQPGSFTVGVPEGWPEFREHPNYGEQGALGDSTAVRFVSPDGSELIAVERVTDFLSDNAAEDYLADYRRALAEGIPEVVVTEVVVTGVEELPGGALQATLRTREGEDAQDQLRRTSYLRLVPDGSDLWVVRVSVPTEREGIGRTELFEPVVADFAPSS